MKLFTHKHKFEVVRTIWPYQDGWGIRCKTKKCHMLLESGLSKELAGSICEQQNFYQKEKQ